MPMYGPAILGQYSATAARRVDWVGDVLTGLIKVTLHTSTYIPDPDIHTFYSDVTNEVTGTNYTAGGLALVSPTLTTDATNNYVILDAADVTWTNLTIAAARYAVIRKDTGTPTASPVLGWADFGGNQSATGANFVVPWDATGVLRYLY
jgi:hypothetical protein